MYLSNILKHKTFCNFYGPFLACSDVSFDSIQIRFLCTLTTCTNTHYIIIDSFIDISMKRVAVIVHLHVPLKSKFARALNSLE